MPKLSINFDPKDWLHLLSVYPKVFKKAAVRAINKTLIQASNVGVRAMGRRYNLPVARLKRGMKVIRATSARMVGVISAIEKPRGGLGSDRPGVITYRGTSQKVRTRGGVRKLSRTKGGALQASRRTFKSAGKGGVTYSIIKGRKKRMARGFITGVTSGVNRKSSVKSSTTITAGVFKRTGVKKAPGKGSYYKRRVTRGPFVGQYLRREVIKRVVGPSIPSMFLVQGRPAAALFIRKNFGRIFANQVAFARRQLIKTRKRRAA